MNNNSKIKSIISVFIIVMILIMNTVVLAEDTNYSATMSLTTNSKLKEGETVTINVSLTNVNAGAGIDALTATLDYDTDVFETLATSSFTSSTNWTPTFSETTNKMTLLKSQKVTAPETMFTINLKVKQSINVDSTTITLKNIAVSGGILANGGTGDIKVSNSSVTISKEKQEVINKEEPKQNTIANNTVIKDTTTTQEKLPKTGAVQYGAIAIIVVAIIAILSYVSYKKIEKDVK